MNTPLQVPPDGGFHFDWSTIIGLITTVGGGIAAWFTGRHMKAKELAKVEAEVQSHEIDNVEKAIEIWRKLAEQMNLQVTELKAQITLLGDQVLSLKNENAALKGQVENLAKENQNLKEQVAGLKIENDKLMEEIFRLKNSHQ